MKIRDIIKIVNKDKKFTDTIYIGDIARKEFNIDNADNYDDQTRLISYYVGNWHCTDSTVGYKVYFFDGVPVAISSQLGRKQDENIEWFSKEAYNTVKDYVVSFVVYHDSIAICDMDEELRDSYRIHYNSQQYEYNKAIPTFNKEGVKIVESHRGTGYNDKRQYEPSLVRIEFADGRTEWVEVKELEFPYNVVADKLETTKT